MVPVLGRWEPTAIPMAASNATENRSGASPLNGETVWWGVASCELGEEEEEVAGWPMIFPVDDIL